MVFPLIVEANLIDLTLLSNTIPKKQPIEIDRENIIKNIEQTFSSSQKIIMIEGLNETGKTTLLAQFSRKHKSNCISFFVGDDYWKSNLTYFLTEMIRQMTNVCSEGLKSHILSMDYEEFEDFKLIQVFTRLYNDLCKQARQKGIPYYIVIDGLDKIGPSTGEENILKYLPKGDRDGVFVLLSSLKGIDYDFQYFPMQIPFFSKLETEILLQDNLEKEEIDYVYSVSDGMPGYILEISRQLRDSKPKDLVIKNLPPTLNILLERNWANYDEDVDLKKFIALMTYTPEAVKVENAFKILDLTEIQLYKYIDELNFIEERENKIYLLSAYKSFFKEKLKEIKTEILQRLINFYESETSNSKALIYLPELYEQQEQYKSLTNLIDIENVYHTMQSTQQLSIVRKNLRILSKMANRNEDWKNLSWSILTESVFTEISTTPPAVKGQIKALLSLDLYDEALKIAYSCVLPEDRLILLSYICNYMKDNGIEISNDILISIEESIDLVDTTVNLSEELVDKLIDICSNIFPINTALSLKLLERVVNKTGENVEKEKLMDYLLVRLLFRVGNDNEEIDQIRNQIDSNVLQNFIKATTDSINDKDAEEVFRQVELINDTSAKLFYLQHWVEKNMETGDASKVVDYALNIMTDSNEYTPTQRHLRQFAEPLVYSDKMEEVRLIFNKIENLKSTIIKNPIEEYTKLELTLSKIEKKWSEDLSIERYYSVYIGLDELQDYDSRCLVLINLLENHKVILDSDKKLYKELKDQLIMDFNRLITSSADHFKVTKKIVSNLTVIDPNLALNFVSRLNTKKRRFNGFYEVIKAYLKESNHNQIDLDFLLSILSNIDEKPNRDWVLVQILRRVIKVDLLDNKVRVKFFGLIKEIDSIIGKSLAFAYYINWIHDLVGKSELVYKELLISFDKVDSDNEKKKLGFQIVEILSLNNKSYAEDFYNKLIKNNNHENIFDTRLFNLVNEVIELLIRMIPDISKSDDFKFKIKQLKNIIFSIPSSYQQCVLLTSLTLRCAVNDHREFIVENAEKCLDILEKCNGDIDTQSKIVVDIAPLLYEYEKGIFFEKHRGLKSTYLRDAAVTNIIKYLITKRPADDPIDIKSFQQKINYPEALKITELINYLEVDSNFLPMISCFVESLIERTSHKKYRSKLREKQLISIAEQLAKIIESKLPDKKNIKHDGYKIVCYGYLSKLRDTATLRANSRWNTLFPTRSELKEKALAIPNLSDKIFVLVNLGKSTHFVDEVMGITLINEAENHLQFINNPLDRAERYELVAEAYQETSNSKAAKFLLEQAMEIAKACSQEQGKDQILGGLIDLAHSIDPNLAQSYASNLETAESFINLNERILTLSLHSDPQKINVYGKEQADRILYDVFSKVLKTICSGRGTIHHNEVIGKYLNYSMGQSFETIVLGISWYVENTIAGTKNLGNSELSDLFSAIFQLLELIRNVEISIYNNSIEPQKDNFYKVLTETNIQTFGLHEQEEALNIIKKWINQNVKEYLKIYDPYFNEEMIEIFKYLNVPARIFVYTSEKTAEIDGIQSRYAQYWDRICDHIPPETHFYVFHTKSGETPLHDRFIISENSGLDLGTSLNGFGSKFSTITFQDIEQKEKIEREIISPLINMPPTYYKDVKLGMKMFTW